MRMLRIACVAHALAITWLAKKTPFPLADSSTAALGASPLRYLNRKMRPYTGLEPRGGWEGSDRSATLRDERRGGGEIAKRRRERARSEGGRERGGHARQGLQRGLVEAVELLHLDALHAHLLDQLREDPGVALDRRPLHRAETRVRSRGARGGK